jgi:hypothetical protein
LKFYEFCEEIENYLSENWKYLSEKKSIGFRLIMLKEIDESRDIKEEKWKNYSNFILPFISIIICKIFLELK